MTPLRMFDFRAWSIRYKLLVGVALAVTLPLLLVFVIGVNTVTSALVENYEANLEYASRAAVTNIASNLDAVLNETLNASLDQRLAGQVAVYARTVPDVTAPVSPSIRNNTINVLNAQLVRHPRFQAIRLLSAEGALLLSVGDTAGYPGLTEIFQGDQPAFQQIIRANVTPEAPLLLAPYTDLFTDQLVLESVALVTSQDTLLGYLVFTLNTDLLLNQPLTASLEGIDSSQYLYLLDGDGWPLTRIKDVEPFSRQFTLRSVGDEEDEEELGTEVVRYFQNWDNEIVEVTGRHAILEPYGWTVVAEVALDDIFEPIIEGLIRRVTPIILLSALLGLGLIFILNNQVTLPLGRLTYVAEEIASGNLQTDIPSTRRADEIGQLQLALATMTDNLRQSIDVLEERVQARTRDLEATSLIAQEAAREDDLQALLDNTVQLIVDKFPAIYHAQVFLIDSIGEYASLIASTGEAGRQLLARGHRLAVGSVSVIGRVTELGEMVIARDTSTSRVHRKNEFLKETRAEMALPLIYGDRVLGALDVQSKLPYAFTEEEQQVFSTLATELAIIINGVQQQAVLQARLLDMEMQSRALTQADWNQLLSASQRRGFMEAQVGANGQASGWSPWQQQAVDERRVITSPLQSDNTVFLAVPIFSREDEVLGAIEWRVDRGRLNDQTTRMAEQLSRRLSNSMETVRLLERSKLLAERERLVNQISGKLTNEPNVAYILETAVDELSSILQTSRVNIQLRPSAVVPASGPSENA